MDIDLLRTFIELESSGTMSSAARRLFVTQATVSARIAQLEELLGVRLFVRSKSGTRTTPEGKRLSASAHQIIQTWESAKADLDGALLQRERLSVGGEFALSTSLLPNWLIALRSKGRPIHLRAVVDSAERLLDAVERDELDVAVLYSPLKRPRIKTKLVLKEELVCVSTKAGCSPGELDDYVYVDWGPDFAAQHERTLPKLRHSSTVIELGPLALRYLLGAGGSGYFRTRAVAPYLRSAKLHLVPKMPRFSYSIYAAAGPRVAPELLDWALAQLSSSSKAKVTAWA